MNESASRARAVRLRFLRRSQRLGSIEGLVRRPHLELISRSGEAMGTYTPDFAYTLPGRGLVAEEVRAIATAECRLREKHFAPDYGVHVRIIPADQAARTPVEEI